VVAVANLEKLPGSTQLKIKNAISDVAKIRMAKKSLIIRALKSAKKRDICDLEKHLSGTSTLIFTNENPFKIYGIIKRNRVMASAKGGQVAPKDIFVPKGPTPVPPGPAISTFQKAGLKTRVEAGKIAVMDEKCVVKTGDVISDDVVAVLNLLKIQPMELVMNVVAAWEDGIIYSKDVLDVDPEEYVRGIERAVQCAVNLSVNTNYPTKIAMPFMIQKAFREAKGLCVSANIFEKDFIGDVLAKAVQEARSLECMVPKDQ
jgi:large subunit ribosomal protein L10